MRVQLQLAKVQEEKKKSKPATSGRNEHETNLKQLQREKKVTPTQKQQTERQTKKKKKEEENNNNILKASTWSSWRAYHAQLLEPRERRLQQINFAECLLQQPADMAKKSLAIQTTAKTKLKVSQRMAARSASATSVWCLGGIRISICSANNSFSATLAQVSISISIAAIIFLFKHKLRCVRKSFVANKINMRMRMSKKKNEYKKIVSRSISNYPSRARRMTKCEACGMWHAACGMRQGVAGKVSQLLDKWMPALRGEGCRARCAVDSRRIWCDAEKLLLIFYSTDRQPEEVIRPGTIALHGSLSENGWHFHFIRAECWSR